jgi:hypothetical protein
MEAGLHPRNARQEQHMNGRDSLDRRTQPLPVNVLDYHANERVAKAVAFVGSYLSWVMLGFLVALAAVFGS